MEIVGLIFSILGFIVGVIGALISYFGWRYVRMSKWVSFREKVIKQLSKTPHMQNPYSMQGSFSEQVKYCMFNLIQNEYLRK